MMKSLFYLVLAVLLAGEVSAQTLAEPDTVIKDSLITAPPFSTSQAWEFVDNVVQSNIFWKSQQSPVRYALQRLLDHSREPFDSIRSRLVIEDFSQLEVEPADPLLTNSIRVRWLNDSTFVVDPKGWSPDLYLTEETRLTYPEDTATATLPMRQTDNIFPADTSGMPAGTQVNPDTILITLIDTAAIRSLGISMHRYSNNRITPSLDSGRFTGLISTDRSMVNYYMTGDTWKTKEDSPFRVMEGEHQLDSLQYAIDQLLEYTSERDSVILWMDNLHGNKVPFWLKQGDDKAYRFWVKNYNNDSLTIWVGNPAPNEISLLMEDDVKVDRLTKEEIYHLPKFVEIPQRLLKEMPVLEPEPVYWNFKFGSVFSMNQTYLSNWTKGGESSFSTMVDLLGEATYNNKDAKTQWINSFRLNYGTLSTKENGFRKNNDLLEMNSKFNGNAWGKIGMSSTFYMKNQLAKGYNYPNDSLVVSKFLNPGSLTVGFGFEYKPFKNTTLNVAPLSYKITFVLDTASIDQRVHGIEEGKKAKKEMGTQIVLYNKLTPTEDLTIVNRMRLFSNYVDKPQNVDLDWELIMDQKINWFFTIRFNLHLIYDDNVRFAVFDTEGAPVMLPDGSEKKVAKPQFKEFIGLSLQFNF